MQVARRHAVTLHGVHQRRKNGRRRQARCDSERLPESARDALSDGAVESGAPSGQAALFVGDVVAFVGNVIDEAHEGIESGECVALGFGQEEKRVIKIAVRGFDDALAFFVGIRERKLTAMEFCRVRSGFAICC